MSYQICVSFKVDRPRFPSNISSSKRIGRRSELFGQEVLGKEVKQCISWSFLGGSKIIRRPNHGTITNAGRKSLAVNAASRKWAGIMVDTPPNRWTPPHITVKKLSPFLLLAGPLSPVVVADTAFTLGTVAVLPFYTCMVVAPQAEITKKLVASSIPYMVLGTLYAYLLYLSWTPDTLQLIFASKYFLPELPGIAKMFSSEMTLASAWIHLLTVDLFAARQVYHDGLLNDVETRHSVALCLLSCPVGILVHFITKALSRSRQSRKRGNTVTK